METWDQRRGHGRAKRREMDSLWDHIEAEEVTLDTSGPEHEIVILLRDLARPRSLFEHQIEAVESFGDRLLPIESEIYATIETGSEMLDTSLDCTFP